MINNENIIIEKDLFNTQIFGLEMGNMTINSLPGESMKLIEIQINEAMESAKKLGYQHLTCKIDTNCSDVVRSLEKNNMRLADTLITYRFNYARTHLKERIHHCVLDDCKEKDLPYLKDISKKVFKIDRFHSDEELDNKKCDFYYESWIENSFNGFADKIIVAYLNDKPVGYTTGKLPDEKGLGHLVLSAVSDECSGKGVYTSMIHEGVKWLDGKAKFLQVGTQINNIAVQKAWIKLGFTVNDSAYIFQRRI